MDPALGGPQFTQWKRILNIGLPAGGEFAIMFVYMAVIYYALRNFGAAAPAGFGIGLRLLRGIQMPALSIGFSAGALARQNLWAGKRARGRGTFREVLRVC